MSLSKFSYWEAFKNDKVIYADWEYCYPQARTKQEWRYHNATLRIQTLKVGRGPIEVYDVWRDKADQWDRIFDLLEQGYMFVSHQALAEIRSDLCDERILKYALNGQVYDTYQNERLIQGLNDPDGNWDTKKIVKNEDGEFEDGDEDTNYSGFALDDLIFRYCGVKIPKLYQDARNWLARDLKPELLKYCEEDVKYLPRILEQQLKLIKQYGLEEQVWLHNELLGTSYLFHKYGVPINRSELDKYTTLYTQKAEELSGELIEKLPKIPYTDTQLIDLYFKKFWLKGQGLCGFTNKTKAEEAVKKNQNHVINTTVRNWIEKHREQLLRTPSLTAHAQRLTAFKRLGYRIESTGKDVLKAYCLENEAPELETYLTWVDYNTLLEKTLTKFQPGYYMRSDGTVRTSMSWCAPSNSRSSSREPNLQNLSRELKSLYGTPPGMIKVGYDLSAIEFYKVLNDYPERDLINVILDSSQDVHCHMGAIYFDKDYKYLLENRKDKKHEANTLRNAAKTVTYFLIYKTACEKGSKYVTGVNRLIEEFKSQLGWSLDKQLAEQLIKRGEQMLSGWTNAKREVDRSIKEAVQSREHKLALRGAMNALYKHDLIRDKLYTPNEYDDSGEIIKREYINGRTIYSQLIAGPIAVAAKSAVNRIQKELFYKYGPTKARLSLFVHDSFDVYCAPEIVEDVKSIMIKGILEEVFRVADFGTLPVSIEGGSSEEPEQKITYDGRNFYYG